MEKMYHNFYRLIVKISAIFAAVLFLLTRPQSITSNLQFLVFLSKFSKFGHPTNLASFSPRPFRWHRAKINSSRSWKIRRYSPGWFSRYIPKSNTKRLFVSFLVFGRLQRKVRILKQAGNFQLNHFLFCRFIFKGDDDIFLNRFLLKELLDQYEVNDAADIVIGSVLRNSPRVTNHTSKGKKLMITIKVGLKWGVDFEHFVL